jgi:hypothetical protein
MSDLEVLVLLALFGASLWGQIVLCGWLEGGNG